MKYSEYLFSCMLKKINSIYDSLEYDVQYEVAINLYKDFQKSKYNIGQKKEDLCMLEYISDTLNNSSKENPKNFDFFTNKN